jgi:hypothetical protein
MIGWTSSLLNRALSELYFSYFLVSCAEVSLSSFTDLENIVATRISLLQSARQKAERQQIGSLATPLAKGLKELEKRCLIRLSQAARDANQVQIALNSVMRAHKLYPQSSAEVSEEFANVLWEQGEQTTAIQYLEHVVRPLDNLEDRDAQTTTYRALLRARLVSFSKASESNPILSSSLGILDGHCVLRKANHDLGRLFPKSHPGVGARTIT